MTEDPTNKPVPTLEEANAATDRFLQKTGDQVSFFSFIIQRTLGTICGTLAGMIVYMLILNTSIWPPSDFLLSNWPGGLIGGLIGFFASGPVLTIMGWIKSILTGITTGK